MKVRIEFHTDNAAWKDNPECEIDWLLQKVNDAFVTGNFPLTLFDTNGNKIGSMEVLEEDEEEDEE